MGVKICFLDKERKHIYHLNDVNVSAGDCKHSKFYLTLADMNFSSYFLPKKHLKVDQIGEKVDIKIVTS